jgi:hypothetical protein
MREAGVPRTEEVVTVCTKRRARPTGGGHARTTRGPAQRTGGAKRRPRIEEGSDDAANDTTIIEAGAP